jgi:hypothetical protein
MPLSIALGQAELEEGSTIRAHEMEKRAPVHDDYALARQRPRWWLALLLCHKRQRGVLRSTWRRVACLWHPGDTAA